MPTSRGRAFPLAQRSVRLESSQQGGKRREESQREAAGSPARRVPQGGAAFRPNGSVWSTRPLPDNGILPSEISVFA